MESWDYVVALAGNPNTGKSTVFNALTGLRQHTGNWPGKTVARAEGGFAVAAGGDSQIQARPEATRRRLCFRQRLDLLPDHHRAQLRGDPGSDAPHEDDRREQKS